MRKLTIGMATYDDYDGVYFTIQALRMYHSEIINDVEFVIINNSPSEKYHNALTGLSKHVKQPIKCVQFTDYTATSVKNLVFDHADTPYVLVVDCHVLLEAGSVKKLIDFFDSGMDEGNLLQGPLLHDDLCSVSTSFNNEWGSGMQGKWNNDPEYVDSSSKPFEIHAQGMGMFACRKDSWLRYSEYLRGFGGEEVYIHNKYRLSGKKTLCLPFMRWVHRFTRINGAPYPNKWHDRYKNYIVGRLELGMSYDDVDTEFTKYLSVDQMMQIKKEVALMFASDLQTYIPENIIVTNNQQGKCGCGK